MENIIKKLKNQIQSLKTQIKEITNQIEKYRNEGGAEDAGVTRDFLDKLEFLSDRVAKLQKNLAIYHKAKSSNFINIGSTVELSIDKNIKKEITLVLPQDANPEDGFISANSPLGKAVLNKQKGETVIFTTPMGQREMEITNAK